MSNIARCEIKTKEVEIGYCPNGELCQIAGAAHTKLHHHDGFNTPVRQIATTDHVPGAPKKSRPSDKDTGVRRRLF